jgi:hypothetical protein
MDRDIRQRELLITATLLHAGNPSRFVDQVIAPLLVEAERRGAERGWDEGYQEGTRHGMSGYKAGDKPGAWQKAFNADNPHRSSQQ